MKPILYPLSTLKQIRDNFVDELNQANQGKETSLAFLKNPLIQQSSVSNGEIFQVIIVGGSIFKSALVKKENNHLVIVSLFEKKLPLLKNKNIFFSLINKYLNVGVQIVAINFAFPLQPLLRNNLLDGRLTSATKEHKLAGLINRFIGVELEKYIRKRRIKVSVVSDTICLLLSSKTDVAGVVGTGTNFAFFLDKNTAVNLESGNFNKFPQTETGKEINKRSLNPGQQLFEKEVSGAYLYQHYSVILSSTSELNQLAEKGDFLAQKLFERSASLIACQIAGIYLYQESNLKFKILNLKFIMEGSLFWQGYHYQDYVKKYLKLLTVPENAISFIKINNSDIIGIAQLAIGANKPRYHL